MDGWMNTAIDMDAGYASYMEFALVKATKCQGPDDSFKFKRRNIITKVKLSWTYSRRIGVVDLVCSCRRETTGVTGKEQQSEQTKWNQQDVLQKLLEKSEMIMMLIMIMIIRIFCNLPVTLYAKFVRAHIKSTCSSHDNFKVPKTIILEPKMC